MKETILTVSVIFLIATGGAPVLAFAQHAGHGDSSPSLPPPGPTVRTGKTTGKIVEADRTSITVEAEQKGRTVKDKYILDGGTKTKGNIEVGAEVLVKYREVLGARIATNVEVKKVKRPAATQ